MYTHIYLSLSLSLSIYIYIHLSLSICIYVYIYIYIYTYASALRQPCAGQGEGGPLHQGCQHPLLPLRPCPRPIQGRAGIDMQRGPDHPQGRNISW